MATVIITSISSSPGDTPVQVAGTVDGVATVVVVDLTTISAAAVPRLLMLQKTRQTAISGALTTLTGLIGTPIIVT